MSEESIPTTMKRLVVAAPGPDVASCKLEIQEVPVPQPSSKEVLIKVVAAPINPSDYGTWYRCRPEQCPMVTGKEGCGIIVKGATDFVAGMTTKVGMKVGFVGLKNNQGSYSEYVVVDAMKGVFPMPQDVPIEDAASFFVNPYTAIGILDVCKQEGSKAFVHTAAASQLGQMLVKLAPSEEVEIINVVRREEQADMLKELGAKHVVVTGGSDEATWKEELKTKIEELNATVAFDAVAGRSTGALLDVLPRKGVVHVYGGLAGKVEDLNPMDLIYKEKQIKGFFLQNWILKGGLVGTVPRLMTASRKVNAGLAGGWSSTQFHDTTLEDAHSSLVEFLGSSITGKKLRIRFDN